MGRKGQKIDHYMNKHHLSFISSRHYYIDTGEFICYSSIKTVYGKIGTEAKMKMMKVSCEGRIDGYGDSGKLDT